MYERFKLKKAAMKQNTEVNSPSGAQRAIVIDKSGAPPKVLAIWQHETIMNF